MKDFRWMFLPYCLFQVEGDVYVVCNRGYKPVGMNVEKEWVDYVDTVKVRIEGLTPRRVALLSWKGDTALDRIYLYNDGCSPLLGAEHWEAYSKRLQLLAKLKVVAP